MSDIQDGGPAFPRLYPRSDEDGTHGMTLRDYFAAKALPAIIALTGKESSTQIDCRVAYDYADAMLKARAK